MLRPLLLLPTTWAEVDEPIKSVLLDFLMELRWCGLCADRQGGLRHNSSKVPSCALMCVFSSELSMQGGLSK